MSRPQAALWMIGCALVGAVLLGACGGSDTQSVDTPFGFSIDVPKDASPKETGVAEIQGMYDHLDLNPQLESCVKEKISNLPDSEFERLNDLPEAQTSQQTFAISDRFITQCTPPSGQTLAPNPSHTTMEAIRYTLKHRIELDLGRLQGLPPGISDCMGRRIDAVPDGDLAAILNSPQPQQQAFGKKIGVACARQALKG